MTAQRTEYDKVYALLVHLCQHQAPTDPAALCVMEAFNSLAEIHTPDQLPSAGEQPTAESLPQAVAHLDRLLCQSSQLTETLRLVEVRGHLHAAMDALR